MGLQEKTPKGVLVHPGLVDYATGYPEPYVVSTVNALALARASINWFSRMGLQHEIVMGQGHSFMSPLMKHVNCLTKTSTDIHLASTNRRRGGAI